MKRILITGGTVFVSKYVAEYFVNTRNEVYVLNRNNRPQIQGVHLIQADRNELGDKLKNLEFDTIIDVTAYTEKDVINLLDSGVKFQDYILISSSAVYPEYGNQPFVEDGETARNSFWGDYGTNKIAAEAALLKEVPDAYILRPPYLYGPYNNVYREAFVFECALNDRKFYLPGKGDMKLQFFHVEDMCRFMEILLEKKPKQHIFNVGNRDVISIRDWVNLCYQAVGKTPEYVEVDMDIPQRNYFPFSNYEYVLSTDRQRALMQDTKALYDGICESYEWYRNNASDVNRRLYIEYIDENFD